MGLPQAHHLSASNAITQRLVSPDLPSVGRCSFPSHSVVCSPFHESDESSLMHWKVRWLALACDDRDFARLPSTKWMSTEDARIVIACHTVPHHLTLHIQFFPADQFSDRPASKIVRCQNPSVHSNVPIPDADHSRSGFSGSFRNRACQSRIWRMSDAGVRPRIVKSESASSSPCGSNLRR